MLYIHHPQVEDFHDYNKIIQVKIMEIKNHTPLQYVVNNPFYMQVYMYS